jgi:hypothetical protein
MTTATKTSGSVTSTGLTISFRWKLFLPTVEKKDDEEEEIGGFT